MPAQTFYRQVRIPILATGEKRLGFRVSDQLNHIFAANECLTVLGLEVERVVGQQSANMGPAVSLWYTGPYGAPHRAVEFIDSPGQSATDKANSFLALNPDFRVLFHADISDKSIRQPITKLLFIIQRLAYVARRDVPMVAALASPSDLAGGAVAWARDLNGVGADPLLINASAGLLPGLTPTLGIYQPANGGIYAGLSTCCFAPLAAIPPSVAVDCQAGSALICDGTPPPIVTECPPPCTPPPPTFPPTLPPDTQTTTTETFTFTFTTTDTNTTTPPPNDKQCRYVYRSKWNCVSEVWSNGTFVSADCIEFPCVPVDWSQDIPEGITAPSDEGCYAWKIECGTVCSDANDCVSAPNPPSRPTLPAPSDCCPDICRYTWRSFVECDSEGNGSWSEPSLVDTTCINDTSCDTPEWTAMRPSWVDPSPNDDCIRWYVACDEDSSCDVTGDCPSPSSEVTPGTPLEDIPETCCKKYCKYTWESTFSCGETSQGEWSEPVLVKQECVDGPCEDEDWQVGTEDPSTGDITPTCSAACTATTIICVENEGCVSDSDCPDPTSEETPETPDIDPPKFDIFANGRINGCNLPLNTATFNGDPAMNGVGGKNNPQCPVGSHFVAAIYNKLMSDVSICELSSLCGASVACETGPSCCPSLYNKCGACSWPCDPDGNGNQITFYLTPAGVVSGGQDPSDNICGGFTLIGGGSACLEAPSGGCS